MSIRLYATHTREYITLHEYLGNHMNSGLSVDFLASATSISSPGAMSSHVVASVLMGVASALRHALLQ
jgi:hypothetical protein